MLRLALMLSPEGRLFAFLGFGYGLVLVTILVRRKFRSRPARGG